MKAATALWLLFPASLWTTAAFADCQCMANGRTFHHGEIACLHLPSGPQLAQCGMVLNNSSWIKLQDGCPVAAIAPSRSTLPPSAAGIFGSRPPPAMLCAFTPSPVGGARRRGGKT
jgi:hypothetical protein